ncbi:MAG: MATE family efflux transporter [Bdellovibrionales bacterium]|nr:MATE family efflux transporter [Bdellovibrionales bacterium]
MRYIHSKIINQTLKLTLPISFARILEVGMTTVDTIMIGHLGKNALATVGIAIPLWNILAVFFMGTLFALTPILGREIRHRKFDEAAKVLLAAKSICLIFFLCTVAIFLISGFLFRLLSQPDDLIRFATYFLFVMLFGVPSFLFNQILRQIFEVYKKPGVTVMISCVGFLLNLVGNYMLIYGKWGVPALGIYGSALSTGICWLWMFLAHLWFLKILKLQFSPAKILFSFSLGSKTSIRSFLNQGLPLGAGVFTEVSFFVFTAWMIGQLGKLPLASHHIAINLASITFMLAIGTSSAATILISQTTGLYQAARIFLFGFSGFVIIVTFMTLSAIIFICFPRFLVNLYTNDLDILNFAPKLLWLGGLFQIFDGLQCVGFGILRGIGASKMALRNTLVSYWLIGASSGIFLGSVLGFGAQGYWVGINIGLATAACLHYWSFRLKLCDIRLTKTL